MDAALERSAVRVLHILDGLLNGGIVPQVPCAAMPCPAQAFGRVEPRLIKKLAGPRLDLRQNPIRFPRRADDNVHVIRSNVRDPELPASFRGQLLDRRTNDGAPGPIEDIRLLA